MNEQQQPPEHAKTPEPAQPSKRESRFSVLTALISALAALLGALVGGVSSYMVAQSNNAAQAEVAQIKTRQTAYADLISYQSDLLISDNALEDHYKFNPGDSDDGDKVLKAQQENYGKWLHTDFIVRVVESSPKVDPARKVIHDHNLKIRDLLQDLMDQVDDHKPIDATTTNVLESEYEGMSGLLDDFTKVAKDDVTPAKRGEFHWSFSW